MAGLLRHNVRSRLGGRLKVTKRRQAHSVPLIERLQVRNYRALRDLDLPDLTPLTVFLGPNGSGKSTIFDVFAFLSECFTVGVRKAWDKRGRFKELRSRGAEGEIGGRLSDSTSGADRPSRHSRMNAPANCSAP